MAITPLTSSMINLLTPEAASVKPAGTTTDNGFADILSEAMNTVSATDDIDKASTLALLSGQTDDMSGLLIDSQKAEIALTLALSIRNKVLDAYTEIMRMQV